MENSVQSLFALDWKYHFWADLVQKVKIVNFNLKFGTWINLNMKNSMVIFIFFCFRMKVLFLGNLFQKSKLFAESEI